MKSLSSRKVDLSLLWVLALAAVVELPGLGHGALSYWDESFHAIVARNLLKHPLTPTLIDDPVIPYDVRDWGANHIWLHKPILPLWQIAASFALIGVNTLALRLPSALLRVGSVWLTFLIGRRLFDSRSGLWAAVLQAVNPMTVLLVQGYLFGDHIDSSLLFYVELAVYFLVRTIQSGSRLDAILAGGAAGLAYLSKSYLAVIVVGLAGTAWALPRIGLCRRDESRVSMYHILLIGTAAVATALPWTLWCLYRFPLEYLHEHGYVFTHLNSDVEGWGAPWGRVVSDFLIGIYHVFYTPVLTAVVVSSIQAVRQRKTAIWLPLAWWLGVLIPHLLARTKTPSATLIALPAAYLLLGRLIVEVLRARTKAWIFCGAAFIVAVAWPALIPEWGRSTGDIRLSSIEWFRRSWWVAGHLLATGVLGFGLRRIDHESNVRTTARMRRIVVICLLVLIARTAWSALQVSRRNQNRRDVQELADFVRTRLPVNAILIFDGPDWGDHMAIMFFSGRTCYYPRDRDVDSLAADIENHCAIPYVVSTNSRYGPVVFASRHNHRAIHQWRPPMIASSKSR